MTDVPTFAAASPPPAPDYVRKGEEVVWIGGPTLALLVSQVVGLLTTFLFLSFFLAGLAGRLENIGIAALGLVLLVLFVVIVILQAMRIRRTQYIVTRQSIYTRTGIIGQTVIQTTFDKITDISLKQDVLGRILGFASLLINTAGSGTPPVRMDGLRNALQTKSLIEAAREHFLRRPEREPAKPTAAPRIPKFIPDRLLVKVTCTTTKRTFKRPVEEAGKLAKCPHCGKTHVVKEAARGRAGTA